MDTDWITSPTARRILVHWADARPAWLWAADGRTLLWRNPAARLFGAKLKKRGLKLAVEAAPLKGRIARLIRLGSMNRTSLARLHFLLGDKPLSETCACTPLQLEDGQVGLLAVGVEPIEGDLLVEADWADPASLHLFPAHSEFLLLGADGAIRGRSPAAPAGYPDPGNAPDGGRVTLPAESGGAVMRVTRFRASPQGAELVLYRPVTQDAEVTEPPDTAPAGIDSAPPAQSPEGAVAEIAAPSVAAMPDARSLTSLFDRLASDSRLYAPLGAADDQLLQPVAPKAEPPEEPPSDTPAEPRQFRIIGRRFTPSVTPPSEGPPDSEPEAAPAQPARTGAAPTPQATETVADVPADAEAVERASRYNFDELSRILNDRVNGDARGEASPKAVEEPAHKTGGDAGLVNLTGETFVLNRLPLGILVFREQQVLFANRALLELTGHETIDSLRTAGLSTLFPSDDAPFEGAGPVTQIVRRDGVQVPVTARLQSIAWQGKPALLLSASAAERRLGHESAVKTFAEILADAREEGFIATDAIGVVTMISAHGRIVLGRPETEIVGQPVSALVDRGEIGALKEFLARPARFAETARPSIVLRGSGSGTEMLLFAEGQAGIVTGYFGLVRRKRQPQAPQAAAGEEPALLGRVSRGVRRPLNTIVGFSDIIASAAFGPIDNPRYVEYASDIRTAGHEIAALVDELDDYARLRDGRYETRPTDIDLTSLLEGCVVRVRAQANVSRVLVRSAISERLPRIRADRASLGQAILNLMASAIDQTPVGGTVVLSARVEEDGGVAVHVRDSSGQKGDLSERFVVFRDGVSRDGEALSPVRSSVGLQLTRSLLQVNACSLSVDPAGAGGMLFTLVIPEDLTVRD